MMPRRRPHGGRSNAGLSLVEVMVAITIGLILLAALARLFVSSRATYTLEEGLARVQESGRFAVEFLSRDIRMAGYIGCANPASTTIQNNLNNPTDYGTNTGPSQYINGHRYTGPGTRPSELNHWTPALPGVINSVTYFQTNDVEPNTDVLVVRSASSGGVKLSGSMNNDNSANVGISSNTVGIKKGDIVMISDCSNADIFQVTGPDDLPNANHLTHNTGSGTVPGNATKPFSKAYPGEAEVMKLNTSVYYIGRRSNSTANPPALFRRQLASDASANAYMDTQELVEGVEAMRFVFGEDTDAPSDGVANIYRNASSVTDWAKVMAVRVGLIATTTGNVDADLDTRTYSIAGVSVGPFNDNKRRRVFSSTILLRNRF